MPHSTWIRQGIESAWEKKKILSADTDTEMDFKAHPNFKITE